MKPQALLLKNEKSSLPVTQTRDHLANETAQVLMTEFILRVSSFTRSKEEMFSTKFLCYSFTVIKKSEIEKVFLFNVEIKRQRRHYDISRFIS